jgi:hypothetical protein
MLVAKEKPSFDFEEFKNQAIADVNLLLAKTGFLLLS